MAKLTEQGLDGAETSLEKLGRDGIRRIVEAGATAEIDRMQARIREAGHAPPGKSGRATGEMLESVGRSGYREFFGGGEENVYPLGNDRRGEPNAVIAYVLNYGRGSSLKGDKFITGDTRAEEIVRQAMQAEADRIAGET